jgi:hypothetical protein
MSAEACSTVVKAKPPTRSDLMDVAKDFLATGVGIPGDNATLLEGVAAQLIPVRLVPCQGGVLVVLRSARLAIPSVGDLDFPLDSDEPLPTCTCEAVKLDESDFITASTMIRELAASTEPSTTSPSARRVLSPVPVMTNDGNAIVSSPSGDSTLKRVVVRLIVEDRFKD